MEEAFGFSEQALDRPTTVKEGMRAVIWLKAQPDADPHESTGKMVSLTSASLTVAAVVARFTANPSLTHPLRVVKAADLEIAPHLRPKARSMPHSKANDEGIEPMDPSFSA